MAIRPIDTRREGSVIEIDRSPDPTVDAVPSIWHAESRVVSWLLVAIVLTIPLEITKTIFPIQQIELSRLLMAVGVCWLLVRRPGGWPISRGLTIGIGAVLVVPLLSFLATRWPDGLLATLAPIYYAGFSIFVARAISDRAGLAKVGVAMLISGGVIAVIAMAQEVGDFYLWREGLLNVVGRANTTFSDPNITARFLILALLSVLGIAAVATKDDRRLSLALAATVVILAAGVVLTQSRFGWIILLIVLPLSALLLRPRRIVTAYAAIFAAAFVVFSLVNGTAIGRASEVAASVSGAFGGDEPISAQGGLTRSENQPYFPPRKVVGHDFFELLPLDGVRFYLLEAGVAMWEDNPITGVGTGGYRPQILGPYLGFVPYDRLGAPTALPHTFLSQVAAENGVAGLAALLLFLTTIALGLARAFRARDHLIRTAAVVTGLSILVVFLSSQAEGRFLTEPYLWLGIGIVAALRLIPEDIADKHRDRSPLVESAEEAPAPLAPTRPGAASG
jgi:hypothetical protein